MVAEAEAAASVWGISPVMAPATFAACSVFAFLALRSGRRPNKRRSSAIRLADQLRPRDLCRMYSRHAQSAVSGCSSDCPDVGIKVSTGCRSTMCPRDYCQMVNRVLISCGRAAAVLHDPAELPVQQMPLHSCHGITTWPQLPQTSWPCARLSAWHSLRNCMENDATHWSISNPHSPC